MDLGQRVRITCPRAGIRLNQTHPNETKKNPCVTWTIVVVEGEPDPFSVNEITDELMPVLLTIDISEEAGEFFL